MIDVDVSVAENGQLVLSAGDEAREAIKDSLDSGSHFWTVLADIFEPYYTNGGFQPFDASLGNPFVGLTGAPCVAESMDVDEDGQCTIEGRLWYFADYMVECPLRLLVDEGHVTFNFSG